MFDPRIAMLIATVFCATPAWAADALPSEFLGGWTKLSATLATDEKTGAVERILINGIGIGRRSYHEPGYNCQINRVTKSVDDADAQDHVYSIDMICQYEDQSPSSHRVHAVWAIRNVNGKDVLIISSATSIQVLQRDVSSEGEGDARKWAKEAEQCSDKGDAACDRAMIEWNNLVAAGCKYTGRPHSFDPNGWHC